MPKKTTSQWEFGELFPAQALRKVLTVSELTTQIRLLLEGQIGVLWVTGEITNLKTQSSGHIYFTLKDAESQLSCVLFRGEFGVDRSPLKEGAKINVRGELTVYEQRGQYQMRVLAVEAQGIGALQAAFEKLKQKLGAEGMFAPGRKRPIPKYPARIGIVTSPSGAALQDILHVIERRNRSLELILAPCRVQGEGAAQEIASAIRLLNEFHAHHQRANSNSEDAARAPSPGGEGEISARNTQQRTPNNDQPLTSQHGLDLILLTRGGGSLEDLWAFNEEIVARAIFESRLPIVSAVGHEIDFTIADFVADLRAATPSAAAELITEGPFSSCQFLAAAAQRMKTLVGQRLEDKRYVLDQARERLRRSSPRRKCADWSQRLDELQSSLGRCANQAVKRHRSTWKTVVERLSRVRPLLLLKQRREVFRQEETRLREQILHQMRELKHRVESAESRLKLLGPEQVLGRGYSITIHATSGKVLRNANRVKPGDKIRTRLQTGEIESKVERQ